LGNGIGKDGGVDEDSMDSPHVVIRRKMDERQRQAESRVPLPPIYTNSERKEPSPDIEWREADPVPMEPMDDWSNNTSTDRFEDRNRQWSSAGFDFQRAARGETYPEQGDDEESGEGENGIDQLGLTPSQRRAHERRERRRIARERAFSGETKTNKGW